MRSRSGIFDIRAERSHCAAESMTSTRADFRRSPAARLLRQDQFQHEGGCALQRIVIAASCCRATHLSGRPGLGFISTQSRSGLRPNKRKHNRQRTRSPTLDNRSPEPGKLLALGALSRDAPRGLPIKIATMSLLLPPSAFRMVCCIANGLCWGVENPKTGERTRDG